MPLYPTEVRHGRGGYRGASGGLSRPAPQPFRPPTPGGSPVRPPAFPANDPRFVRPPFRPVPAVGGLGRVILGPVAVGFSIGWELGTLIWGNPFAGGGIAPAPVPGSGQAWYNQGWLFGGAIPGEIPNGNWVNTDSGSARPLNPMPDTTYDGQLNRSIMEVYGDPYAFFVTGPPFADPASAAASGTAITISQQSVDIYTAESYSRLIGIAESAWIPASEYVAPVGNPAIGTPIVYPSAVPELAPIGWPGVPVPNPFGDALPQPGQQPSENPLTNPVTRPGRPVTVPLSPLVPPVVSIPPGIVPAPGSSPVTPTVPTVTISPAPGGGVQPSVGVPSSPTPPRTPPERDTKERKVHVGNTVSPGFLTVINTVTESLDFVDSLYEAVKPINGSTCALHDYACKFQEIYNAWDDPRFDAALFVESWVNNQFEDYLFGQLGRATGGASAGIGVTTGVGRGTGSSNHLVADLDGDGTLESPIPQLDYDPNTGAWNLTWLGFSTPSVGG